MNEQEDSIIYVDSNGLINNKDKLQEISNSKALHLLNLAYDVTPSYLISVVVSEVGLLPCTSVPVILRENK